MDGDTPTQSEIQNEASSILGMWSVFGLTPELQTRATALLANAEMHKTANNKLSRRTLDAVGEIKLFMFFTGN